MIYEVLETWGQTMLIVMAVTLGDCTEAAISNAPYRMPNTTETHYDAYGFCHITYRAKRSDFPAGMADLNIWRRNRELVTKMEMDGVMTDKFQAPHYITLNLGEL